MFILVPRKEYYQLFRKMLPAAFAVLCFGAVFSVVVFLMMKNVVRPLHVFEEEICKIQQGDLENRSYQKTLIPEYDHLLDEVMIMKQRIQGLLEEREAAQRVQAKARVDQLLYKINPHFLMNSLDTIHWLAVAENTKEIDKVARALNKLLYYNLKVDRNTVRLEEEIQAVRQYVLLQQSRFTFQFAVDIQDEKALQARIPRFILQPLVENAIYHGLRENGHLVLMADVEEKLNIYVKDDGEGMEPQMLDELQEEARRGKKEGNKLGIGLNYVIQILREQFGENVTIQVMSRKQEGTIIHISMPFEE
ncbi:MAG: sensor histidine kinase [Eisenbergiella sp.]